jgi:hypothetical protein
MRGRRNERLDEQRIVHINDAAAAGLQVFAVQAFEELALV